MSPPLTDPAPDEAETTPLLEADEPAPLEIINAEGARPVLLICDHASCRVPRRLNGLGLPPDELRRHIGWDLGIAPVARGLAERLDAPALLAGYSRLVIDLNRQPGDPESIPEVSDGTEVPGNRALPEAERIARQKALFDPYHEAITRTLAHLWRVHGHAPALISLHSFTPSLRGGPPRPWHIGTLWHHDPRLAGPFMSRLAEANPELCIGDNQPYAGAELGYTVDAHGESAGLPCLGLEVRQDGLATPADQQRWVERLHNALSGVLADSTLYRVRHY
ncbi:Predicted N-formylglutamate amidohydrolase [Roseospirillum parvum]|uniref:Predicted N-formylglutamate amidohydrolase n=2 Tax=Roseospirillum parvum TaxID=83401 RepID=A0A1G7Y6C6_9PROT|nr:Predicted N-formylglutamate amidohydrolase [Roseospirillum parvum]